MKEYLKGLAMLIGLMLGFYLAGCIAEFIGNVITINVLSKIIIIAGITGAVILIKKEDK